MVSCLLLSQCDMNFILSKITTIDMSGIDPAGCVLPTVSEERDLESDKTQDPTSSAADLGPSWQEKLSQAQNYKAEGNEKYKSGAIKAAIGKYHRAILYLKGIEDAQQSMPFNKGLPEMELLRKVPAEALPDIMKLKMDTYNNLAACILQTDAPAYDKISRYCERVLEIDPENVKALYRKGVSLYHLKKVEAAQQALQRAKDKPGGKKDPNITRYLKLCEGDLARQEQKMKITYKGMFDKQEVDGSHSPKTVARTRKETEPPMTSLNEAESYPTGDAGRRYTT